MKLFNKDGVEMMDVKSLTREGDVLVIKGKMMGAMATTIHIRPEEAWQAFRLFSWSIILHMPSILMKGFMQSRDKA